MNTLIGNGWLHEGSSPWPKALGLQLRRSAMRKCMYFPIPAALRDLPPPSPNHAAMPSPPLRPSMPEPPIVPRKRDPRRDARMFEQVPHDIYGPRKPRQESKRAWWEDPIALGSLLIVCPPAGVAAVWSSKHYSNDARWALTVMTALMMCLVTALAVAAIALR